MHRVCIKVNLSILKILQTRKGVLFVFKLKENVYGKKASFKGNVYEREQVLKNVSVFMCRKAPSE